MNMIPLPLRFVAADPVVFAVQRHVDIYIDIYICIYIYIHMYLCIGTGSSDRNRERWGAGVEYHFQEI